MSEQAQNNNQQMIVIALVVVAALLAAIIGVLVWQGKRNAVPAPQTQTQPQTAPATTQGTTGQTSANQAPAAFDPKTATKVTGTPEAWVKAYYTACANGDWKAAFDALPADKKAGNSPDALKEQVSGYGIKSFKVTSATVQGDKATVLVDQVTASYGTFVNAWTFVKKNGTWYVESKAVTGMK